MRPCIREPPEPLSKIATYPSQGGSPGTPFPSMKSKVILKRALIALKVLLLPITLPLSGLVLLIDNGLFEIPRNTYEAWRDAGK